jgi:HEAT-like repeat
VSLPLSYNSRNALLCSSFLIFTSLAFLAIYSSRWAAGEDDPYSMIGDESEGDYEDMVIAGASAIDRLALGVGGKCLWPLLSEQIAPMLGSPDWKQRRAALVAISLASEGCKKFLAPQIKAVVQGVVQFTRDSHPRVRHAAVRCLGEMIGDYSDPSSAEGDNAGALPPDMKGNATISGGTAARAKGKDNVESIQDAAGDIILPALIESMGATLNGSVPRVRALAAQATVNFTLAQYCSEDNLEGHEKALLHALFGILNEVPLKSVSYHYYDDVQLVLSRSPAVIAHFLSSFSPFIVISSIAGQGRCHHVRRLRGSGDRRALRRVLPNVRHHRQAAHRYMRG